MFELYGNEKAASLGLAEVASVSRLKPLALLLKPGFGVENPPFALAPLFIDIDELASDSIMKSQAIISSAIAWDIWTIF